MLGMPVGEWGGWRAGRWSRSVSECFCSGRCRSWCVQLSISWCEHTVLGDGRDLEGVGCADGWRGRLLAVASSGGLVVGASVAWRATWSRELIGRAAGAALWSAGECPGWTFQMLVMTGHQGQGRIRPPPSRHRGEVDMAYQPWRRAEKLCTGVKEMNSLNGPGWRSHLRQAHNLPTNALDQ